MCIITGFIDIMSTTKAINAGKRWSAEDDELLVENAATLSHEQLATMFGRTTTAIRLRLLSKLCDELMILKFFDDPVDDDDEREAYSNMVDAMIRYGNPRYDEIMAFHTERQRRSESVKHETKKINKRSVRSGPASDLIKREDKMTTRGIIDAIKSGTIDIDEKLWKTKNLAEYIFAVMSNEK